MGAWRRVCVRQRLTRQRVQRGAAQPRTGGLSGTAPRLHLRHGPEPFKHRMALSHPHLTGEETEAREVMQRLQGTGARRTQRRRAAPALPLGRGAGGDARRARPGCARSVQGPCAHQNAGGHEIGPAPFCTFSAVHRRHFGGPLPFLARPLTCMVSPCAANRLCPSPAPPRPAHRLRPGMSALRAGRHPCRRGWQGVTRAPKLRGPCSF